MFSRNRIFILRVLRQFSKNIHDITFVYTVNIYNMYIPGWIMYHVSTHRIPLRTHYSSSYRQFMTTTMKYYVFVVTIPKCLKNTNA